MGRREYLVNPTFRENNPLFGSHRLEQLPILMDIL
jgi:hypothetical protein